MLNIDSCKLKINDNSIKDMNKSCFLTDKKTDYEGTILKDNQELIKDYLPFGVKAINLNNITKEVILEFSAKILKEKYFENINKNNIECVFENLNNTGISFNANTIIDNAEILRFDNTYNLTVKEPVSSYLDYMRGYRLNSRYSVSEFDTSVIFTKDVKTPALKERVIFYDKQKDVMRDKELHKFVNVNQFENVLRAETNIRSFSAIRKLLDIKKEKNNIRETILLKDILNSNQKPISIIFDSITNAEPSLFDEYRNKDYMISDIVQIEGLKSIVASCNYDMKIIKTFVRQHTKKRTSVSYWNGKFKRILRMITAEKNQIKYDYIGEIKNLLNAA